MDKQNEYDWNRAVRTALVAGGITQHEAAKRLDVELSTLRAWQYGRRRPWCRQHEAIRRFLGQVLGPGWERRLEELWSQGFDPPANLHDARWIAAAWPRADRADTAYRFGRTEHQARMQASALERAGRDRWIIFPRMKLRGQADGLSALLSLAQEF